MFILTYQRPGSQSAKGYKCHKYKKGVLSFLTNLSGPYKRVICLLRHNVIVTFEKDNGKDKNEISS